MSQGFYNNDDVDTSVSKQMSLTAVIVCAVITVVLIVATVFLIILSKKAKADAEQERKDHPNDPLAGKEKSDNASFYNGTGITCGVIGGIFALVTLGGIWSRAGVSEIKETYGEVNESA